MAKRALVKDQDKFILRLPTGMRERIKERAARSGHSMNAEVVNLLESALIDKIFEESDELRARLVEAARENERAVNDEVIARLEGSFRGAGAISKEDIGQAVQEALAKSLADALERAGITRQLSKHAGQTFTVNLPDDED
ncbi:Arc family DNA-binding protein [Rhizobium leguminosarum]|uniref:Arc family DNA-binding protein n=1 Tax=Rhizobium leguminosarum TaxID=384 RepID=UPI003F976923